MNRISLAASDFATFSASLLGIFPLMIASRKSHPVRYETSEADKILHIHCPITVTVNKQDPKPFIHHMIQFSDRMTKYLI
jgi:hypothetical protein